MLCFQDAIQSARDDGGYFHLEIPATPERIRMACCDRCAVMATFGFAFFKIMVLANGVRYIYI